MRRSARRKWARGPSGAGSRPLVCGEGGVGAVVVERRCSGKSAGLTERKTAWEAIAANGKDRVGKRTWQWTAQAVCAGSPLVEGRT